ncbi:tetratricopeptide repeat protein [Myroides sp. TSA_177.3]|uniref:tetratricopeptide repeat protein n=1 Tax=Myroides sp. TSA_177.3 TaxID=3415650 RepID=UPI0040460C6F
MKQILAIILFFSFYQGIGQAKKIGPDELLFEQAYLIQNFIQEELALDYYLYSSSVDKSAKELAVDIRDKMLIKAIDLYQELIKEYPKSKWTFRALNNIGFAELALQNKDKAKLHFEQVLKSNANDKEKGGAGSGIMGEPYANYKNRAARELAKIYIEEQNFDKALEYLALTKQYTYQHFCGNAYAEEKITMSLLYAKCYVGLNQIDKAIQTLFPNLLENGLADNSELVHFTYDILSTQYKQEELKSLFAASFENHQIKTIKEKEIQYEQDYITFLGTDIELNSWQLEYLTGEEREQEIKRIYEKSLFTQLLDKNEKE